MDLMTTAQLICFVIIAIEVSVITVLYRRKKQREDVL